MVAHCMKIQETVLNLLPSSLKSILPAGRKCKRQFDQAAYCTIKSGKKIIERLECQ